MASSATTVTVLYFAAAHTETGITSEVIDVGPGGLKLSELGQLLIGRHPDTKLQQVLAASQWSVNLDMVEDPDSIVLRGGEEVAVICPVSGG